MTSKCKTCGIKELHHDPNNLLYDRTCKKFILSNSSEEKEIPQNQRVGGCMTPSKSSGELTPVPPPGKINVGGNSKSTLAGKSDSKSVDTTNRNEADTQTLSDKDIWHKKLYGEGYLFREIHVKTFIAQLKKFPLHCEECNNNLSVYINKLAGERLIKLKGGR